MQHELGWIFVAGVFVIAISGILESFISSSKVSAKFLLFTKALFAVSLYLIAALPVAMVLYPPGSRIGFIIALIAFVLVLVWAIFETYKIVSDVVSGAVSRIFTIETVEKVERILEHGGNLYLIRTEEKVVFEIKVCNYWEITNALETHENLKILIEYYPKTKIVKNYLLET